MLHFYQDLGIGEDRIDEMAPHIAMNDGLDRAYIPLMEDDIAKIITESL